VKKGIVLMLFMVFSTFTFPTLLGQSKVAYLSTEKVKLSRERATKNSVSIPYKVVGGHFMVEADLNQDRGLFILDTGAPYLVVNQTVLEKNLDGAGVNDEIFAAETTVDLFRWRNEEWKKLPALAIDLQHLEKNNKERILGLIGYDLLRHSELIFDTKNRQLHISAGTDEPSWAGVAPDLQYPLLIQGHLPVVELRIGGRTFRFGVDTGAESNLLDQKCLEKLDASLYQEVGIDRITGVDAKVQSCKVMQISGLELGEKVNFTIMDLSHLDKFQDFKIDGLIGSDLLHHFIFSVNYRKRQLNIWKTN
jgi:predicted aspartyl protease